MAEPALFEIDAARLAGLYARLKCDGCGTVLEPATGQTWVKAGCGHFCSACQAAGRHSAGGPR